MKVGRPLSCVLMMAALASDGCGSGGETGPVPAALVRPIVAGAVDADDPSVVALLALSSTQEAQCTATIVSPHLLLTAAHCIAETSGFRYFIFPGPDDRAATSRDLLPVSRAVFDPGYTGNPSEGHDLGVVVLATPLGPPPLPMNRAPLPASARGKPGRVVGYGLSDGVGQSGAGIKRQATSPLADYDGHLIRIAADPHGSCNGDSGGPLFLDTGGGEVIVGVVSFGVDTTCQGDSYYQRLDTQIAWVDEQIAAVDPPPADTSPAPSWPADAGVPAASERSAPPDARTTDPPDAAGATRSAAEIVGEGGCSLGPSRSNPRPLAWLMVAALLASRERSRRARRTTGGGLWIRHHSSRCRRLMMR